MSRASTRRAVILAGGMGKRLAPYTLVIPKPLLPIGTIPILEIVLRQLAHHDFGHVTIALGYLSEFVKAVAGDGTRFGIEIDYSQEGKPLSTVGPLKLIADLPDDFLVMNADLLTTLDYGALWHYHREGGAVATISTYVKTTKLELGVLQTDDNNRINGFEEKPTLRHNVSMGVYVFRKQILQHIPDNQPYGFDTLMTRLLEEGDVVKAYPFTGRWFDIGVPADFEKAQVDFEDNRPAYLPPAATSHTEIS